MKVTHIKDILPVSMDNDQVKNVNGRLLVGKEDGATNFCMRYFEIEKQGHTPMHTHDWEHEIFVHSGTGEVFIEGKWHPLTQGSAALVPSGVEHQFRNISDEVFIFLCMIPSGAPEL
ncbi:MAG: cupin domain-containing protein [Desulfobacteraceae bacterium]|nr:cupin domain-containing protein [Desulfobacteraceae bacterium]